MIWVVAMVWKDSNKNDTNDGKGKENENVGDNGT